MKISSYKEIFLFIAVSLSFIFPFFLQGENSPKIKLCLTMVIKNDSKTILESLESVKNHIDCLSICDRGSTDNTTEIINKFMQDSGIPGKIYRHEWVNVNRSFYKTYTIQMAQKTLTELGFELANTYLIDLEPDQKLAVQAAFKRDQLKKDSYLICEKSSQLSCNNTHLLRASIPWESVGVTDEYWAYKQEPYLDGELLKTCLIENPDKDIKIKKLENDIKLLNQALSSEPNNARNVFYLARAHQLLKHHEEAIEGYRARIKLGGRKEEVWCAKYMMGECFEALGKWDEALPIYVEAYQDNSERTEPLYRLAHYYRVKGENNTAHLFAKQGKTIPYPQHQNLFISNPVYDYLFDEELSIVSYYTPYKEDGLTATNQLIINKNIPDHLRAHAYRNILFYVEKLPNASFQPTLIPTHDQQKIAHAFNSFSYDPIIFSKSIDADGSQIRLGYDFSCFQGSSPHVELHDGYLMLIYEVVVVDGKPHHIHRFLKLDKNFIVKGLSKPFIFQQFGLETSGEMTIDNVGKKLTIPITLDNGAGYLVYIDFSTIQSLLEPLTVSSEEYHVILPNLEDFQDLQFDLIKSLEKKNSEGNPFFVTDFTPKENLTNQDYISIQNKLKTITISSYIEKIYPTKTENLTTKEDFETRSSKGLKQILIDPDRNLFPVKKLEKIGNGSDMCIVSFCSYNRDYHSFLKSLPEALQKTGFNGYFLYRMGGYPTPTGKEIQYMGVPYVFKVFMMLEAYKLGFNKVLWIDTAVVPLNDPTPIFSILEETGAYFYGSQDDGYARYILPKTRELLKKLTGTDVIEQPHVYAPIIGLKMNSPKIKNLIKSYYQMVSLGTPFVSCAPEEFVFTALLGQPEYKDCQAQFRYKLLQCVLWGKETPSEMARLKSEGYYFYHHSH